MFGGIGLTGRASGLYNQTWTWDGTDWSLRGGSTAPAVLIPVPSPVSVPPVLPCKSRSRRHPAKRSPAPVRMRRIDPGQLRRRLRIRERGPGAERRMHPARSRAPGSSRPEPPQWLAMGDVDDIRIEVLEDHEDADVRAMLVDLALVEQGHFDHPPETAEQLTERLRPAPHFRGDNHVLVARAS